MLEVCGAAAQAQQEASAALTELGLSHAAAVFTNGGLLKPDLVVMTPSARVALTMDQPSAFCINPPHRPLGHTILTWRLLVLHDWQVSDLHLYSNAPFYCWQIPIAHNGLLLVESPLK